MRIGRLPRPSIARPPAAAGKQFGLRAEVIVIAVARPVAMAIILFPAYRRTDGQWPPLRQRNFRTPHPSAAPTPSPQGEGRGKAFSLPVDFSCGRFFRKELLTSAVLKAFPLRGRWQAAPRICAISLRTRVHKRLTPLLPVGLKQYRKSPFSTRIASPAGAG